MCGIAGYIGQSKKPKVSYELITNLFDNLETRGIDASGVWGTEHGSNGRVIYQKEPIRSSKFIKTDFWNRLKKIRTDMLLVHSRRTSPNGGNASCNANNHPFVSLDRRIGMVHNGNIEEADYLKHKYQTLSETDSECLLRVFEHGMESSEYKIENVPDDVNARMNGIRDIWSYISTGAMAVALGERIDDHRRGLFLFRNEKRPLWLADLRPLLGQVFFFSSPEIWYSAIENSPNLKKHCWNSQKIIELPYFQAWYLSIDQNNPIVNENNFFRFKLETRNTNKEFQEGDFKRIKPAQVSLNVVTKLNDNDELPKKKENNIFKSQPYKDDSWRNYEEDRDIPYWEDDMVNSNEHERLCKEIVQIAENINISTENLCMESSMTPNDYSILLESLEQIKSDLEGTLQIING